MKVFIVLSLCAVATVSHRHHDNWNELDREEFSDTQYRTRREYYYRYNGQISTGIPNGNNQHAATRLQADILLTFPSSERTAILKITKIRFGSMNRELPEPQEIQPFQIFETKETQEEQEKLLELPLRFKYNDGLVSDIEFDREDRPWSENIKRAILNMLQVNIKKNIRVGQNEEMRDMKNREELRELDETRGADFFKIQERTLEGDCETFYTFNMPQQERAERRTMKITKTINFAKCRERVDIRYNHRFGEMSESHGDDNSEEKQATKTTTIFNYQILGDKDRFLIKEVEVRSQYTFVPFSKQDRVLTTFVTNKLELIKVKENENRVQEPRSKGRQSLLYNPESEIKIERFYMNGDTELTSDHPYKMIKEKYSLIEQTLRTLVRMMTDKELEIDTETTHQFARLVDLLRMCSKEEIRRVHEQLFENNERFDQRTQEKVRDILVDALAVAGTKNTIEHLIEKIENRKITVLKATKALQTLVNTRVISEKQVDGVLRLCKNDISERNPMLKQTCWLTVGGMLSGLCTRNLDRLAIEFTTEKRCPRELKEKYLKELAEFFRNAENRYEKVLALKTLANAGLDLSIGELEKIILDRKEERLIRVEAIDALRRLRREMPRKIQKILMPILKDRQEHPEVRMNALAQIMHSFPDRAILDQIAHMLHDERSRQVQIFTNTMMRTFAKSINPFEKKMAEDLQTALRQARVLTNKWTDSRYVHLPYYHNYHKVGLTLDLAAIFTKDSILPRELMASTDTLIYSHWKKHAAQLGFIQYNFEQLLEKLIRNIEEKNIDEVVVRGKRSVSFRPDELLRSLYKKLNVKSRRDRSEVFAMVYIRHNDLNFAILPLDEQTVPEVTKIIHEGKIDLTRVEQLFARGYNFNTHFATYFYEISRRIPTSVGMPLINVGKLPLVAGIEGEAKVQLTSTKLEHLNGAKFILDLKPKITGTHVTQMYVRNPAVSSGIKMIQSLKVNLPLNMDAELKVNEKLQVKYILKVPKEKKQIFLLQSRAVTVTSSWLKDSKNYIEPKEKTIHFEHHEQRLRTIERNIGEKWVGINLNVRGQYRENPLMLFRRSLMDMFLAETNVEVNMEPKRDALREIAAKFEVDFVKENRTEEPEFSRFYADNSENALFETDFEDENEFLKKRKDRRNDREDRLMRNERENRHRRDRSEEDISEEWDKKHNDGRRLRNERNERERIEEFGRYLREYKPEKGYKLRVHVAVETVGLRDERKAMIQLHTGCDEKLRYCKLHVRGRRSRLPEENREWTIEINAQTLYPQSVRTLKELKERKHREFIATVDCEWGADKKYFINTKIQGEQNHEQKRRLNNVEKNAKSVGRYDEILMATQLNQYKLFVSYNVNEYFKKYVNLLYDTLKSRNMWNLKAVPATNWDSKIFAKLTIDPRTQQYITLFVETPNEKMEIRDLLLPVKVAPLMLNIHRPEIPIRTVRRFVKKTISKEGAECKVSSHLVKTFDDNEIKLPLTTCYSVLAKDCSSEQPKFAVLLKKLTRDTKEKKMKILGENGVLELQRVDERFEIKVNGNRVEDEESLQDMGINLRDEIATVELEDVLVRFDGHAASVKISPIYKNGQCGICGHYDEDREDELRKADNELTSDVQEYHRSYFHNDEECEIEEDVVRERKNYDRLRNNLEEERRNDEEKETRRPVMRTKVIEYNHEICFSMKPVEMCPEDTYVGNDKTVEKKITFACLSRSKHEAAKLARRARTHILDMEEYKPSFVDTVFIPNECLVF